MAFHKDRVWGHCYLPFTLGNSLKSSNTIYLRHTPILMTPSFSCRFFLTRSSMLTDKLQLNDDENEYLLIGTKQQLSKVILIALGALTLVLSLWQEI